MSISQTDVYLDTHVIVWLYQYKTQKFPKKVIETLENMDNRLLFSPMVKLELQYLYEIRRIQHSPNQILDTLSDILDLKMCQKSWEKIIEMAIRCDFTRDAFDRLIVAHAMLDNDYIITKDEKMTANYSNCIW